MKVTPLIEAMWKEDDKLVKRLIQDPAIINKKDSDGRTALIEAIIRRNHEYVELFIQKGADVNTIDAGGWSPLHFAAQECDTYIIKLLLDKNVSVNDKNQHGNTPLFVALNNLNRDRESTIETCHLLLEKGADPNIANNYDVSVMSLFRDSIKDDEVVSLLNRKTNAG